MIACGIDAGLKGGIAIINGRKVVDLLLMPTFTRNDRAEVDSVKVLNIIEHYHISALAIERLWAFSRDGSQGNFTFGMNYGKLLGVIDPIIDIVYMPTPKEWQKKLLGAECAGHTKESSIAYVQRRWPYVDLTPGQKRKPSDGLADAVCLAEYARMTYSGEI